MSLSLVLNSRVGAALLGARRVAASAFAAQQPVQWTRAFSDSSSSGNNNDDSPNESSKEPEVRNFHAQVRNTRNRRVMQRQQDHIAALNEAWDEERHGAVDSEDWMGFEGDMDAVTPEGTPVWLDSMRQLAAIHDEKINRGKLARRAAAEARMNVTYVRQVDEFGRAYGTGRRKESTARVWIKKSADAFQGRIQVNGKDLVDYFVRDTYRADVLKPFSIVDQVGQFDVIATVAGGGLTGQSGAIRHGISRALLNFEPEYRGALKKEGLLTRDSRMVERKKPGQPKARKKFQWVKR